jgi:hypothetical protein
VERHRFLVSICKGSNPFTPAIWQKVGRDEEVDERPQARGSARSADGRWREYARGRRPEVGLALPIGRLPTALRGPSSTLQKVAPIVRRSAHNKAGDRRFALPQLAWALLWADLWEPSAAFLKAHC